MAGIGHLSALYYCKCAVKNSVWEYKNQYHHYCHGHHHHLNNNKSSVSKALESLVVPSLCRSQADVPAQSWESVLNTLILQSQSQQMITKWHSWVWWPLCQLVQCHTSIPPTLNCVLHTSMCILTTERPNVKSHYRWFKHMLHEHSRHAGQIFTFNRSVSFRIFRKFRRFISELTATKECH